jgi:RNA polymerase-associated protein RTF1
MDMEISDDESEDGQISKYEQEEEKDRKLFKKAPSPVDEPVTMEELEKCRLTRDMLAKYCMAPWFQDYVQSMLLAHSFNLYLHFGHIAAWVRYLIGQEDGLPVYRICEILSAFWLLCLWSGWSLNYSKTSAPTSSSHTR